MGDETRPRPFWFAALGGLVGSAVGVVWVMLEHAALGALDASSPRLPVLLAIPVLAPSTT